MHTLPDACRMAPTRCGVACRCNDGGHHRVPRPAYVTSAAARRPLLLAVLGPVPLELPPAHRWDALAAAPLEVLLPLALAGDLLEVPPDPADERGELAHRRAPPWPLRALPAGWRRDSSHSRTASFSSRVAKKLDGATSSERCLGTSVVGRPPAR